MQLVFYSDGMELYEETVSIPHVSISYSDFLTESRSFKQRAENAIGELASIPGDDALTLTEKLEENLETMGYLEYLVENCRDKQTLKIQNNQEIKSDVLKICRYLSAEMPYAGEMQNVILFVLKKEFGVNSISELESLAKR